MTFDLVVPGQHIVDGGIFPPPVAVAELIAKLPPPSQFNVITNNLNNIPIQCFFSLFVYFNLSCNYNFC